MSSRHIPSPGAEPDPDEVEDAIDLSTEDPDASRRGLARYEEKDLFDHPIPWPG